MKKIVIGLIAIVAISFFSALAWPSSEFFACSDYCPLPQEQYMVKAYKWIKNPVLCYALWGKPGTVYGWGERDYCEPILK